jgi:hypothetical protein
MKTTVKYNVLKSLRERFGEQTFTYTDIVKEFLIHNGVIAKHEDYNWRDHRGYYACAISCYSGDYLYNYSKTSPLRLVRYEGEAVRYGVEAERVTNYEKATVAVLNDLRERSGNTAVSQHGYDTIQRVGMKVELEKIGNLRDQILAVLQMGVITTTVDEFIQTLDKADLLVKLFNEYKTR